MNFLYIIIFSFVPKDALLGRRDVAVTLLAAFLAFFSQMVTGMLITSLKNS